MKTAFLRSAARALRRHIRAAGIEPEIQYREFLRDRASRRRFRRAGAMLRRAGVAYASSLSPPMPF